MFCHPLRATWMLICHRLIDSLRCCVSVHWGCMNRQRDDILKAIRKHEAAKWKEGHPDEVIGVPPRKELGIQEMTYFVCGIYFLNLSYVLSSDQ